MLEKIPWSLFESIQHAFQFEDMVGVMLEATGLVDVNIFVKRELGM